MFTGIVEEAGSVQAIRVLPESIQLILRTRICGRGLRIGDSLALNGCCLTVTNVSKKNRDFLARFDLLKETWNLTNLQFAKPGSLVNLERPLTPQSRLGGHFVTGHVDGIGTIVRLQQKNADRLLDIAAPPEIMRYVIQKGSIAVDGISLTVAGVQKGRFRLWIIPHTWEVTALCQRRVGDAVNLETDLLGKYVERFISSGWKY